MVGKGGGGSVARSHFFARVSLFSRARVSKLRCDFTPRCARRVIAAVPNRAMRSLNARILKNSTRLRAVNSF